MAQTTDAISFVAAKVALSTDNFSTSDVDVAGFTNSIALSGGTRQTSDVYTIDGDTAIIMGGKREPLEITVRAVYTEGANEPFELARAAYEDSSDLYVRWTPKGGASGDFQYTSSVGVVTSAPYPVGEAGTGEPVMIEFTVRAASIVKAVL